MKHSNIIFNLISNTSESNGVKSFSNSSSEHSSTLRAVLTEYDFFFVQGAYISYKSF